MRSACCLMRRFLRPNNLTQPALCCALAVGTHRSLLMCLAMTQSSKHLSQLRPQVPDVSGMMQTSDYPCMRKSKDVPDMHFRNFDIPVSAIVWQPDPPLPCGRVLTKATTRSRPLVACYRFGVRLGCMTPNAAVERVGSLQLLPVDSVLPTSYFTSFWLGCRYRRSTTTGAPSRCSATTARTASWTSCSQTSRTLGTSTARSQVQNC